ncbi:MAG: hypothetical protein EBY39_08120 [Flavobacteriia bacterium]|nr:hypothetical protein [Flavobacteriia bacterium]
MNTTGKSLKENFGYLFEEEKSQKKYKILYNKEQTAPQNIKGQVAFILSTDLMISAIQGLDEPLLLKIHREPNISKDIDHAQGKTISFSLLTQKVKNYEGFKKFYGLNSDNVENIAVMNKIGQRYVIAVNQLMLSGATRMMLEAKENVLKISKQAYVTMFRTFKTTSNYYPTAKNRRTIDFTKIFLSVSDRIDNGELLKTSEQEGKYKEDRDFVGVSDAKKVAYATYYFFKGLTHDQKRGFGGKGKINDFFNMITSRDMEIDKAVKLFKDGWHKGKKSKKVAKYIEKQFDEMIESILSASSKEEATQVAQKTIEAVPNVDITTASEQEVEDAIPEEYTQMFSSSGTPEAQDKDTQEIFTKDFIDWIDHYKDLYYDLKHGNLKEELVNGEKSKESLLHYIGQLAFLLITLGHRATNFIQWKSPSELNKVKIEIQGFTQGLGKIVKEIEEINVNNETDSSKRTIKQKIEKVKASAQNAKRDIKGMSEEDTLALVSRKFDELEDYETSDIDSRSILDETKKNFDEWMELFMALKIGLKDGSLKNDLESGKFSKNDFLKDIGEMFYNLYVIEDAVIKHTQWKSDEEKNQFKLQISGFRKSLAEAAKEIDEINVSNETDRVKSDTRKEIKKAKNDAVETIKDIEDMSEEQTLALVSRKFNEFDDLKDKLEDYENLNPTLKNLEPTISGKPSFDQGADRGDPKDLFKRILKKAKDENKPPYVETRGEKDVVYLTFPQNFTFKDKGDVFEHIDVMLFNFSDTIDFVLRDHQRFHIIEGVHKIAMDDLLEFLDDDGSRELEQITAQLDTSSGTSGPETLTKYSGDSRTFDKGMENLSLQNVDQLPTVRSIQEFDDDQAKNAELKKIASLLLTGQLFAKKAGIVDRHTVFGKAAGKTFKLKDIAFGLKTELERVQRMSDLKDDLDTEIDSFTKKFDQALEALGGIDRIGIRLTESNQYDYTLSMSKSAIDTIMAFDESNSNEFDANAIYTQIFAQADNLNISYSSGSDLDGDDTLKDPDTDDTVRESFARTVEELNDLLEQDDWGFTAISTSSFTVSSDNSKVFYYFVMLEEDDVHISVRKIFSKTNIATLYQLPQCKLSEIRLDLVDGYNANDIGPEEEDEETLKEATRFAESADEKDSKVYNKNTASTLEELLNHETIAYLDETFYSDSYKMKDFLREFFTQSDSESREDSPFRPEDFADQASDLYQTATQNLDLVQELKQEIVSHNQLKPRTQPLLTTISEVYSGDIKEVWDAVFASKKPNKDLFVSAFTLTTNVTLQKFLSKNKSLVESRILGEAWSNKKKIAALVGFGAVSAVVGVFAGAAMLAASFGVASQWSAFVSGAMLAWNAISGYKYRKIQSQYKKDPIYAIEEIMGLKDSEESLQKILQVTIADSVCSLVNENYKPARVEHDEVASKIDAYNERKNRQLEKLNNLSPEQKEKAKELLTNIKTSMRQTGAPYHNQLGISSDEIINAAFDEFMFGDTLSEETRNKLLNGEEAPNDQESVANMMDAMDEALKHTGIDNKFKQYVHDYTKNKGQGWLRGFTDHFTSEEDKQASFEIKGEKFNVPYLKSMDQMNKEYYQVLMHIITGIFVVMRTR